jgi:hypothetical protein
MPTKNISLPSKKILFRNIAISFVVIAVILAIVVGYTAFSRAVINVTIEPIEKDLAYRVLLSAEDPLPSNAIPGQFGEVEASAEASIPLVPDTSDETDIAGGVVTLHNETNSSQLLIATTRLLTTDGLLFRLQDRVLVPAQGTVDAVVKADEVGEEYQIGPTKFTIPGLNNNLQELIYASSAIAMLPGGAEPSTVTETDLLALREKTLSALLVNARNALVEKGLDVPEENLFVTITDETISNEVGEEASALSMKLEAKVAGVAFSEQDLRQTIISTSGARSGILPSSELVYEIQGYDAETKSAAVVGRTSVGSALSTDSSIFSKANFVGATPEEVQRFLLNYEGISAVDVTLSPYWQKRLPRSSRRIDINFLVE